MKERKEEEKEKRITPKVNAIIDYAPCEARTHDLRIAHSIECSYRNMRPTLYQLSQGSLWKTDFLITVSAQWLPYICSSHFDVNVHNLDCQICQISVSNEYSITTNMTCIHLTPLVPRFRLSNVVSSSPRDINNMGMYRYVVILI